MNGYTMIATPVPARSFEQLNLSRHVLFWKPKLRNGLCFLFQLGYWLWKDWIPPVVIVVVNTDSSRDLSPIAALPIFFFRITDLSAVLQLIVEPAPRQVMQLVIQLASCQRGAGVISYFHIHM